jgi:hypothetical protein
LSRNRSLAAAVACTLLAATIPGLPPARVLAVTTRWFEMATFKDFESAELSGVRVSSTGEVSPGLDTRSLKVPEKEVWASLVASDGTAWIATGNQAAVYRVDAASGLAKVYSADDVAFTCLAEAPGGPLYVGSLPAGKIYAVDRGQSKGRILTTLPASYVWSLVVDPHGTLYAGTGPEGLIYRISPSGEAKILHDTLDGNILALALSPAGDLWAGSAAKGLLYRISPSTGSAQVVADFKGREVKALAFDAAGPLYLALNETRTKLASPGKDASRVGIDFHNLAMSLGARFSGSEVTQDGSEVTADASMLRRFDSTASASVAEMDAEGRVQTVFELQEGCILDLEVDADGTVLVASGAGGRVYGIRPRDVSHLLLTLPETQAVTLALASGRLALVGCANPGSVVRVLPGRPPSGRLTLKPMDCGFMSRFGEARWEGVGDVRLATRSGNTGTPDHTWSAWSAAAGPPPVRTGTPAGRYVQARLTFGTDAVARARYLRVHYLNQNQRPAVESLTIAGARAEAQRGDGDDADDADAGATARKLSAALSGLPGVSGLAGLAPGAPGAAGRRSRSRAEPGLPAGPAPAGKAKEAARAAAAPVSSLDKPRSPVREIRWSAADRDGDALVHRLFVRGADETEWLPLTPRAPLEKATFAWNTESVPDGRYVLRVVATDERANPPGEALSGERTSAPFVVDNGRPEITLAVDRARALVNIGVRDALTPVARVEVSVDGQEWRPLHPKDSLLDALAEELVVPLSGLELSPGTHSIAVRAADAEGNVGAARVLVTAGRP